jgi:hypothetical protein
MIHAKARFDHYLDMVSLHAEQAKVHPNPALSLYLQDTRTALFQLEGLCRLYGKMHNGKRFEKMGAKVKVLEDNLGQIDYYAVFYKSFVEDKNIPKEIAQYCYNQYIASCKKANAILNEDGWLNASRINKFKKQLKKVDWVKPDQEFEVMKNALKEEIGEIESFYKEVLNNLDHIEDDVHEARRKIRWIGIYGQALQGGIILHAKGKVDTLLKKYQTQDIVDSPYNVLAAPPNDVEPIPFSKPHFYAVSYIIRALGELKDRGLKNHILVEAIQQLEILSINASKEKVKTILGKNYQEETEILNTAGSLLQQCIDDKILKGLILDK